MQGGCSGTLAASQDSDPPSTCSQPGGSAGSRMPRGACGSQHHPHAPHFREKRWHCREPPWAPQIPSTLSSAWPASGTPSSPAATMGGVATCRTPGDQSKRALLATRKGRQGGSGRCWRTTPNCVSHPCRWPVGSGRQRGVRAGPVRQSHALALPTLPTPPLLPAHATGPPSCHTDTLCTTPPLCHPHLGRTRTTHTPHAALLAAWRRVGPGVGHHSGVGSEEQGQGQETAWSKGPPRPGFGGAEAEPRAGG